MRSSILGVSSPPHPHTLLPMRKATLETRMT
jgi:hypothetical protein